jgi:nitrite reductase (NADH) small subunit
MPEWIPVAHITDCPDGESREVLAGNRVVALFCVDGNYHALDGICPHQGGPLGQGKLSGCVVTCPWHGWQYDVRSGQHQSISSLVHHRFPVKVEGEQIYVDVEA